MWLAFSWDTGDVSGDFSTLTTQYKYEYRVEGNLTIKMCREEALTENSSIIFCQDFLKCEYQVLKSFKTWRWMLGWIPGLVFFFLDQIFSDLNQGNLLTYVTQYIHFRPRVGNLFPVRAISVLMTSFVGDTKVLNTHIHNDDDNGHSCFSLENWSVTFISDPLCDGSLRGTVSLESFHFVWFKQLCNGYKAPSQILPLNDVSAC